MNSTKLRSGVFPGAEALPVWTKVSKYIGDDDETAHTDIHNDRNTYGLRRDHAGMLDAADYGG